MIPRRPVAPKPRLRQPYETSTAIRTEFDRPVTPSHDEGGEPISKKEGFIVGKEIIGPGGGEDWHMHQPFHDVVLYVLEGTACIESDAGVSSITAGDFTYIEPGVVHRWSNVGDRPLELIWFAHCREDRSSAVVSLVDEEEE